MNLFQGRNVVSAVEAKVVVEAKAGVRKSPSFPFLTRLRSGFNLIGLANGSVDQHMGKVSSLEKFKVYLSWMALCVVYFDRKTQHLC